MSNWQFKIPRACLFFLEIFCLYSCMWPISEWHFRSTAAQHRYRIRKVYPNQYNQINATKRWNQRAFTSLVEPTHVPGWMCIVPLLIFTRVSATDPCLSEWDFRSCTSAPGCQSTAPGWHFDVKCTLDPHKKRPSSVTPPCPNIGYFWAVNLTQIFLTKNWNHVKLCYFSHWSVKVLNQHRIQTIN